MNMPSILRTLAHSLAMALPLLSTLPGLVVAQGLQPGLPDAALAIQALSDLPVIKAARAGLDTEQAVAQQYRVGSQEWTASLSAARRQQISPTSERTREWELGIERSVRLPGKAQAYEALGAARQAQAGMALNKVWREQARGLLSLQGIWLREREQARIWQVQLDVLVQQRDAVGKRHKLGDAARLDMQLADAALAQAQAQASAAISRSAAAREVLARMYPGLPEATEWPGTVPDSLGGDAASWVNSQLSQSPELASAKQDSALALAQLKLDQAEARPDPSVGVRWGQARNGAETALGFVVSVPIGGAYRSALEQASRARAAAADAQQAQAARSSEIEASQRWHEANAAREVAVAHVRAYTQLSAVANGLARGYQLGEGSLSEVLTARRLANEQALTSAGAGIDAWLARYRLAIETAALWPMPAP